MTIDGSQLLNEFQAQLVSFGNGIDLQLAHFFITGSTRAVKRR